MFQLNWFADNKKARFFSEWHDFWIFVTCSRFVTGFSTDLFRWTLQAGTPLFRFNRSFPGSTFSTWLTARSHLINFNATETVGLAFLAIPFQFPWRRRRRSPKLGQTLSSIIPSRYTWDGGECFDWQVVECHSKLPLHLIKISNLLIIVCISMNQSGMNIKTKAFCSTNRMWALKRWRTKNAFGNNPPMNKIKTYLRYLWCNLDHGMHSKGHFYIRRSFL